MKKRIIFSFIALLSMAILFATYVGLNKILGIYNLTFRSWVDALFSTLEILLCFVFLSGVISVFCKVFSLKNEKLSVSAAKKIISVVVIGTIAVSSVFIGFFGLLIVAELNKPEHIIERDGAKLLAVVHSRHTTDVYYYDYHNSAVRGRTMRINELYYGSDLFTNNPMSEPHKIFYFDETGNRTNGFNDENAQLLEIAPTAYSTPGSDNIAVNPVFASERDFLEYINNSILDGYEMITDNKWIVQNEDMFITPA